QDAGRVRRQVRIAQRERHAARAQRHDGRGRARLSGTTETATTSHADLDALAAATHAARIELPPSAVLANALDAATTRDERAALLANADGATRSRALAYLDEPLALRERTRRIAWLDADPMR